MNKCELRESGESYEPRKAISISRALLESAWLAGDEEEWSKNVREFVLSRLTQDEIYKDSLQGLELALIKRMDLIKVPGKKNPERFPY